VGGRSVDEIADRFLEQAALSSGGGVPVETVDLARRVLSIEGDPDAASLSLRSIAAEANLDLTEALDGFDQRTGFIAARGIDVSSIRFSTAFGRRLDYYTGFVFELHDPARPDVLQLVGGGRYDRLMTQLGAPSPIAAVGCSIWLERFEGARA
jgi:ATP phosphoribosyltransferase regulatory subunit